jgi:hypothetical protein
MAASGLESLAAASSGMPGRAGPVELGRIPRAHKVTNLATLDVFADGVSGGQDSEPGLHVGAGLRVRF